MQRRVEQTNDNGQAVHSAEHAQEVAGLSLEQVGACLFADSVVVVQDERLDDLFALTEEHMLSAAQADALSTEVACELSILGVVGVCANTHGAEFVGPFEDGVKVAGEFRLNQLNSAQNNDTGGTVERDNVAFLDNDVGAGNSSLLRHRRRSSERLRRIRKERPCHVR